MLFHTNMLIENMYVTAKLHISNKKIFLHSVDSNNRFQNLGLEGKYLILFLFFRIHVKQITYLSRNMFNIADFDERNRHTVITTGGVFLITTRSSINQLYLIIYRRL